MVDRIDQDDSRVGPPWPISDFSFKNDTNEFADLGFMLGISDRMSRVEPICTPLRPVRSTFSHHPELPDPLFILDKPETFTLQDTTLPRLLMFHDSFGLYLKPLMSEHFSHSTYVWSGLFIPNIVVVEKPDFVVQEFMEMFMVNMPNDVVALSP